MENVAKLVKGKIPVNTPCPFKDECSSAKNKTCAHKGLEHTVSFSCGYARAFQIFKRLD
jgi:hypothetical protein